MIVLECDINYTDIYARQINIWLLTTGMHFFDINKLLG